MTFDASAFLSQTVTGPMATSMVACPEGEWQARVSDDGDIREWFREIEWKDKQGNDKSSPGMRIPCLIIDPGPLAMLKREKLIVPFDIFLDVTPTGQFDTGEDKNVKLGQLRAALGQNADTAWNITKIFGAGPFIAKVSQRSDKKDPTIKYAQIDRVTRIS